MIQKTTETPLSHYKRTKIIVSVGPATHEYQKVYDLIEAGANGFRLDFSTGTNKERHEMIAWIRKASKELGMSVSIIQDLEGPKLMLGDFEGVVELRIGQTLSLGYNVNFVETKALPTLYDLSKKVKRGERIYFNNGQVKATVIAIVSDIVHVRVDSGGMLIKHRRIDLPDTNFQSDIITAKDRADIVFGSAEDVDYVSLSFIQSDEDIKAVKKLLSSLNMKAKVIAKFETKASIENMEQIVSEADCLMIAAGDIAHEVLPEAIAVVQDQLISLGRRYAKPIVIANQMLFSMTTSDQPSRSELSEIANAVSSGADCLMLGYETAVGQYPLEAVKIMKKTIVYSEAHGSPKVHVSKFVDRSRQALICQSIVDLAEAIDAAAIVAETKSGLTACELSARRPTKPTIALSFDARTAQQLAIVYGVKPYARAGSKLADAKITQWLKKQKVLNKGDVIVIASGQHPGVVGSTDTIKVRLID